MGNRKLKNLSLFIKSNRWKCIFISTYIFLILSNFVSISQNSNSIWCFGDSAGINFSDTSNLINFSTSLDTRGSCVSIADDNGNLLFYAGTRAGSGVTTTIVFNRDHQMMEEGDSIVGEAWYNELMIIPFPEDSNKYYLFSVGCLNPYGLYYSVIDLSVNGGLGKVIQKNFQVNNLPAWDALAAYKHGNGRDWWLISKHNNGTLGNNKLYITLITPDGITSTSQQIGLVESGNVGNLTFLKDGNKILFSSYQGLLQLMDFDRCSGILSNSVRISSGSLPRFIGSAIAPNGDILYVSTNEMVSKLYQFDLTAANINSTRTTIDSIPWPNFAGGHLRLAPDNKIYWACAYDNGQFYPYMDSVYNIYNMNISVIDQPNILGTACNFMKYNYFLSGKRIYWGLPNNPVYNSGPSLGSACDTLFNKVNEIAMSQIIFNLYYNSDLKTIVLNAGNINGNKIKVNLSDITNRILFSETGTIVNKIYESKFSAESFSSGVYIVTMITDNQKISKKIFVE